jgi:hypothetical protein
VTTQLRLLGILITAVLLSGCGATPGDQSDEGDTSADLASIPNPDSFPWKTGANIGYGVAMKDTENPRGNGIFIAYAGYDVSLKAAEAWATALYKEDLAARGYRHIWAVQGPSDPEYSQFEIGNSKIAANMLPLVTASSKILVVGHSSGTFVAHELLGQLEGGADPKGVTKKRVVYFNLDGGSSGLDEAIVNRLKRAYFVGSFDSKVDTYSPNRSGMVALGEDYASAGGYYQNNAASSGCDAGAIWCVHVTLITTKPHDPANADAALDYSDFVNRPVSRAYIDAKATEAGL